MFRNRLKLSASRRYCVESIARSASAGAKFKMPAATRRISVLSGTHSRPEQVRAAFNAVPPNERKIAEPRWRIEHAQILDPADLPRFAKLAVIPSMQPSHAISDLFFAPSRLGMDRLTGAYAWQSLLRSGCIIPGGSDAPA